MNDLTRKLAEENGRRIVQRMARRGQLNPERLGRAFHENVSEDSVLDGMELELSGSGLKNWGRLNMEAWAVADKLAEEAQARSEVPYEDKPVHPYLAEDVEEPTPAGVLVDLPEHEGWTWVQEVPDASEAVEMGALADAEPQEDPTPDPDESADDAEYGTFWEREPEESTQVATGTLTLDQPDQDLSRPSYEDRARALVDALPDFHPATVAGLLQSIGTIMEGEQEPLREAVFTCLRDDLGETFDEVFSATLRIMYPPKEAPVDDRSEMLSQALDVQVAANLLTCAKELKRLGHPDESFVANLRRDAEAVLRSAGFGLDQDCS